MDKYVLQDKNRVNSNAFNVKSTSNLTSQPGTSSSNGYSSNPYMNRNFIGNPQMNAQIPSMTSYQSNPALKLSLNRE